MAQDNRYIKKTFKVEIEYFDNFDYDENSISDCLDDLQVYTLRVSEIKGKKKKMKDKMIVTKVKIHKEGWINVWFEKRGKKAEFDYDFEGDEPGIGNCNYQEDDKYKRIVCLKCGNS